MNEEAGAGPETPMGPGKGETRAEGEVRPGSEVEGEGGAPPPPSMLSFMERSPGRLLVEAALGGSAGWILAGALGMAEARETVLLAGALLAPLALLLTPLHGPIPVRALRYGGALAVLGTLLVSFTGPGRERPVDELLVLGVLLLGVGTVGHGLFLAGGGDPEENSSWTGPGTPP